MLTDLRLQKYLQGLLSEEEAKDIEGLAARNPEIQARLEALKAQSEIVGRPMWQRVHLERKTRHGGSRTRATILLPVLLTLAVLLTLGRHWFSQPGENSTFTMAGGNGNSLEMLYNSKSGWRYLDAGYRGGDSLTFTVRDSGRYHVAVMAIYGRGKGAEVVPLWADQADRAYDKASPTPTFISAPSMGPETDDPSEKSAGNGELRPSQIVVFYDGTPLPELAAAQVLDIVETRGNERGGLEYQYQVFSSGP